MTKLHFKQTKQTKTTVVFEQVEADGSECFAPVIRSLYVSKHSPHAKKPTLVIHIED